MNIKNLSILFVIKLNKQNKKGLCPINCRITYKKRRKEVSTGEFIKPTDWDAKQQNIYTSNTIEVFRVFKGQPLSTIEIITRGGTVGLNAEIVSPSLQLNINDIGIFTLRENTVDLTVNGASRFQPYSGVQGFYKYNIFADLAVNPFNTKQGITNFYSEIEALTNTNSNALTEFNPTSKYE